MISLDACWSMETIKFYLRFMPLVFLKYSIPYKASVLWMWILFLYSPLSAIGKDLIFAAEYPACIAGWQKDAKFYIAKASLNVDGINVSSQDGLQDPFLCSLPFTTSKRKSYTLTGFLYCWFQFMAVIVCLTDQNVLSGHLPRLPSSASCHSRLWVLVH